MTGKVVIITGGASGIGRATAVAFARQGANVVIGDIDIPAAENTVATIKKTGGEATCLRVDVSASADIRTMVKKAVEQYGGLDYAFNNAGLVGSVAGVVETSEDNWHRVLAINLTGVWLCMKYEIPEMLKRGRGAIANNGSVTGLVGAPGPVANVATKHAVSGLTKSAALQYATQGIRVNAVAAGLVGSALTDQMKTLHPDAEATMLSAVPQGRWCEPEEVAEALIFLCSEGASHVTGAVLPVDGGWTARGKLPKNFPDLSQRDVQINLRRRGTSYLHTNPINRPAATTPSHNRIDTKPATFAPTGKIPVSSQAATSR